MNNTNTISEELEDGMYDANPIPELETSEDFDNWAVTGFGYVIWNGDTFAKSDAAK